MQESSKPCIISLYVCTPIVYTGGIILLAMAKEERINLRTSAEQKQLLAEAAELEGKTITEFMLEVSLSKAQEALLDRRVFVVSPAEYDAFSKALATPGSKERLEKLLAIPTPWE